jgi:rhodanese-related sulfurtransferase
MMYVLLEIIVREGPNDQDVLIVDVREPDEVSLGSIPSSVNLPLSELKDALSPNFGEGDFKKVRIFPLHFNLLQLRLKSPSYVSSP